MLAVKVGVKNGSVLEALARLELNPQDKRGLLESFGFTITENTRLRFGDGVDPDGQPWVPSLRAKLQGGQTMRDTGVLMNSITPLVGTDSVEVGTNVPYALPLHFGATIAPVNGKYLTFRVPGGGWAKKQEVTLPARPFLGITDEDATQIVDLINEFMRTI